MMSVSNTSDNQFIIPFVGLNIGKHEFEYILADSFFEENEYSLIQKGQVLVNLSFEKKESMMIGIYNISGHVIMSCNRCNDKLDVDIEGEYKLVYKFDSTETNDEALVIVFPEEFELDVRNSIVELINVSLPARAVHDDGECSDEMLDLLDEYVVNSEEEFNDEFDEEPEIESNENYKNENAEDAEELSDEIDPRWNALKKLKK